IFLIVYGGSHLYVYLRLIQPVRRVGFASLLIKILFIALCFSFPLLHFVTRGQNGSLVEITNYISSVWMGMIVYLFLATLGFDLARLLLKLAGNNTLQNPRLFTSLVSAIALCITIYGLVEATDIGITRLNVKIPNLPDKLAGTTIAQISDVHMGLIIQGKRLDNIVKLTNSLDPDLIVITGDLVDEQALHMEELVQPLQNLKSKYGVFACTGNHEYFAGIDKAEAFIARGGVQLLRNRWVEVAGGLQIMGRDDPIGTRVVSENIPPLSEIIKGIDPQKPVILLYHTPVTTMDELQRLGICLQLSGHTHKGQLWPFLYIVKKIFAMPYGLFKSGDTTVYVSRGTGTWGPPLRVGAPPEITFITLEKS
ncbi:MAG: metallophosphoesterase, partial [bacterium]|nr:metallophosphoesterase [bacterium]